MAAAGGKLYLIGGTTGAGTPIATIVRIDPVTRRAVRVAALPRPVADASAVTLGRGVYLLGRAGSSASSAVFKLSS